MANAVDDTLLAVINEIGWSMLEKNKQAAKETVYRDMLVASLIGGFNIANSHYIAASLKGNPENIYKTSGIGFGVIIGIALSLGVTTKRSASVTIQGTDYDLGYSKPILKVITKMLLSKILQRFISPITKVVQKLIGPLLKLPKYADLFASINGSRGANNGKAKEMFLRFILWLLIGALGTMMAIKLLTAYRNKLDPKVVVQDKDFINSQEVKLPNLGAPDIQQAMKLNAQLTHKGKFFSEFDSKLKGAVKLTDIANSLQGAKGKGKTDDDVKAEIKMTFDEIKTITNGSVTIHIDGIPAGNDQRVALLRAVKSIMPGVKTTTDVAKFKFTNITIVVFGGKSINVDNIGLYNAAINTINGDAYMMFYPTKNNNHQLTNDEVASVMLHECGHFLTKQNSFAYINMSLGLLTYSSQLLMNPVTRNLVWGSYSHMCATYGRFQEIQADKYTTQLGYGNELASALAKLYRVSPEEITHLSNTDNSDVHSTLKLRYDTLKQYASNYQKKK